jgi:serine/threonine protein kinase
MHDPPAANRGAEGDREQDPDDLVGTVLAGRYRILRRLGTGATATVYLGEHLRIGRRDAIKILHPTVAADPEAAARFLRGARNVSAIRHPNVCTIYDFGETAEGLQFLAMEHVPGEALSDVLAREGALATERAIAIGQQVAEALQAAHDAAIVHRDLKPGNIMVARGQGGEDAIKVVDFDIAKGPAAVEGSELTRAGFVIGTPEYMSPEQLTGDRLDGRSDVYSLGVVLFRMVTGSLPFRASHPQDLMVERLTQPPLRLDEAAPERPFPPSLQQVLDRALARRPADRQASAAALARELAALRARETPRTLFAPSLRPTRRISRRIAAGAALVLLGGAGFGLAAHLRRDTPPTPGTSATELDAWTVDASQADPSGTRSEEDPLPRQDSVPTERDRPHSDSADPVAPPPSPRNAHPQRTAADLGDIHDLLWRQFDASGPPHPSRATLNAIRDTALLVWARSDARSDDRAFAAYIVGYVHMALRNPRECVTWIEQALRLRPDGPGYRDLLDGCREEGG